MQIYQGVILVKNTKCKPRNFLIVKKVHHTPLVRLLVIPFLDLSNPS